MPLMANLDITHLGMRLLPRNTTILGMRLGLLLLHCSIV